MLTEKDYCDYETCVALKELGYDKPSNWGWYKHIRVSNEMLEKHPDLSDSGYMDLTDEYGGPYKREEVYHTYIEPIKRFSRNSLIDTYLGEICSCIHLYDAQKWLREEKGIVVRVIPIYEERKAIKGMSYTCEVIYWNDGYVTDECIEEYTSYEEALSEGVKASVKILEDGLGSN